jgi:glutamyl-tRNA reductase
MTEVRNGIQQTSLQICMVGVNHDTTPLSIREKLSIPREQMSHALECLGNYLDKGVILATCNRTEIYAVGYEGAPLSEAIHRFFVNWSGMPSDDLAPHLHHCSNHDAARHLTETASGLSSMIVGEYEVLGQVRQALEDAEQADMVNLPLRNLLQHAIRTGRRVREDTDISKNALSVSSVAVELATSVVGDIRSSKLLLVGAGEAGKLVARTLYQMGASKITVASRSLGSAKELASALGGTAVDTSQLQTEMAAVDIVVTCTGAPHYIIYRDLVHEVMQSREGRPLVIVDIAVPRDVETEVRQINGVSVYDIDDFTHVSRANRKAREKEVARAMKLIDEEMERFKQRWQALEAKPAVSALMQMAEDIRQQQLSITIKKLPPLSKEDEDSLDAMTKAIVNKILHNPIKCLKCGGHRNDHLCQIVEELFDLNGDVPE